MAQAREDLPRVAPVAVIFGRKVGVAMEWVGRRRYERNAD
jgi:hypothetical protein